MHLKFMMSVVSVMVQIWQLTVMALMYGMLEFVRLWTVAESVMVLHICRLFMRIQMVMALVILL